jgi:hypothetical protein
MIMYLLHHMFTCIEQMWSSMGEDIIEYRMHGQVEIVRLQSYEHL